MKDQTLIRFEGFELDPAARSLKLDGMHISLAPKTFDLLAYLAEHPHRVISKEQLLAAIWPDSFVEESNLSQHIFLLRKALASAASTNRADRIVVTVPGKGYQFAAAVERGPQPATVHSNTHQANHLADGLVIHAVRSVTSVVVEEETDDESPAFLPAIVPPRAAVTLSQSSRRWKIAIAALIPAALIATGAFLIWRHLNAVPAEHIDLVLTELANSTGDPDFTHSLNQALQIDLEQSPFLNVLSRSAIPDTLLQMQRKADESLTPALAQEVCQRNNARVMIDGSISKLGSHYLLILDADSCISDKHLAGYKTEVTSKDEVLNALDRAAGAVRKQLGESAASREQYQMSIAQATTPSFDALVAYNQAGESFRRGDMKASQLLNQRAVALDPNFASAYRILGSSYYNLGDYAQAASYYKKAFDLRERTTERERLGIEVMYYAYALNDYEESIRRTKQFLQIYPNVANSWVSLCNLYARLGEYPRAIDAAEHAIHVDPHSGVAAVELARVYMRATRFADAKAVANAAVAQGKDHWDIHSILFQIAFAEHDADKIKSEGQWGLTHQHINTSLRDLAMAAASQGKLHEALENLSRARTEAMRDGETDFANGILLDTARVLTQFDQSARAATVLKQITGYTGDPSDPGEVALLRAANGDPAFAQHFLAIADTVDERNTVKVYIYVPMVRALLALRSHKPAEAVQLMEPARPYQLSNFDIPYLRAQAETQAGNLTAAADDYRLILSNRGVDPISPLYPLAHLQLARVLAAQKQTEPARAEYKAFLEAWKNADPTIPLLTQAKQDYGKLISNSTNASIKN